MLTYPHRRARSGLTIAATRLAACCSSQCPLPTVVGAGAYAADVSIITRCFAVGGSRAAPQVPEAAQSEPGCHHATRGAAAAAAQTAVSHSAHQNRYYLPAATAAVLLPHCSISIAPYVAVGQAAAAGGGKHQQHILVSGKGVWGSRALCGHVGGCEDVGGGEGRGRGM